MEPLHFGLNERPRRTAVGTFFEETFTTRRSPTAQLICSMEIVICFDNRGGAYV